MLDQPIGTVLVGKIERGDVLPGAKIIPFANHLRKTLGRPRRHILDRLDGPDVLKSVVNLEIELVDPTRPKGEAVLLAETADPVCRQLLTMDRSKVITDTIVQRPKRQGMDARLAGDLGTVSIGIGAVAPVGNLRVGTVVAVRVGVVLARPEGEEAGSRGGPLVEVGQIADGRDEGKQLGHLAVGVKDAQFQQLTDLGLLSRPEKISPLHHDLGHLVLDESLEEGDHLLLGHRGGCARNWHLGGGGGGHLGWFVHILIGLW